MSATAGTAPSSARVPAQADRACERPCGALARLQAATAPLVDEALRRIAREVPGYLHEDAVGEAVLRRSFRDCLELVLVLTVEQREATAEELLSQSQVGARRAEAGRDVADVTRAYRIGFLVVWEGLVRLAEAAGGRAPQLLARQALRVWSLQDQLSAAVEDAHRDRLLQLRESSGRRARALLDALAGLPESREAAERAARAAGLRPNADFVAAVVSGDHGRRPCLPATVAVDEAGETVVLASVRTGIEDAVERLAGELTRLGWQYVGVGICRAGLTGARSSLQLARTAHRAARRTGRDVLRADADWFACMVGNATDQLDPLMREITQCLADDAELAATVSAYLSADRNLTRAAAALYVHPNTVAYRLRRLAETLALDLRTLDGLVRGYTALTMLGQAPGCGGDQPRPRPA